MTGGASGIGLATAQLLARGGAQVAVFDRDVGVLPAGLYGVRCDVSNDASVRRAIDGVADRLDGVDVLVNNAGVGAAGTVEDNNDAEWHRVLDVNVVGIARVTRAALPHLRRSGRPAIVNVCSIAATVGLPQSALYSASMGAVLALTKAMAADYLSEGIRVNCVNPAPVDAFWAHRQVDGAGDRDIERTALQARQSPGVTVSAEQVASAIVYLASPAAASVTGAALAVDAGTHGVRLRAEAT
nr:SDR family oxidoreductase [Phytoactinopolyspora limicola]